MKKVRCQKRAVKITNQKNMTIGYIGLGKMGKNMVDRLTEKGHSPVTYSQSANGTVTSLSAMIDQLPAPRLIWVMVPSAAVQSVLDELTPLLQKGDTVIDGGNSPYRDSIRRAAELTEKGISFIDAGVSGGPGGARNGACIMVGGAEEKYTEYEVLWRDLCVPHGYGYMGSHGAGHFVKMVHNGIEYGMMQSIAEGFDLLKHTKEFDLSMNRVADVYSEGSVITSRLVSWLAHAFKTHGEDLNEISGRASATGEGAWTKAAAEQQAIATPALDAALATRAASQIQPSYQGKVVSAMRGEFGQHPVTRGEDEPSIL
jgi:6-phosphogluconate dehydrogenase